MIRKASILQAALQVVQDRLVDLDGEWGCHQLTGICIYRRRYNLLVRLYRLRALQHTSRLLQMGRPSLQFVQVT